MKYANKDSLETWVKPLSNGAWAICFLNRRSSPAQVDFDWKKETIADPISQATLNPATDYKIYNLWTKTNTGTTKKPLKAEIASHDVLMLKLIR